MTDVKNESPVPDPWPTPPTATVLVVAGVAHVIITAGAVLAINALNGRNETNRNQGG